MTLHIGSVGSPIRANTYEPEVLRQFMAIAAGSSPGAGLNSGICGLGFAVSQNGTPNMSVNVSSGFGIVAGTNNAPVQGVYNVYNDATVNLAIAASNPTNPRIDVVCVTIQDAYYSGATNTALLQVIAGTPGASPTVPAIPANSLALAHIYVGANVTSIVTANINGTAGTNNPDAFPFTPLKLGPMEAWGQDTTVRAIGTGVTTLTGTTVYVNSPGNRLYKLHAVSTPNTPSATPVYGATIIVKDGSTLVQGYGEIAGSGHFTTVTVEYVDTPAAGVHQYYVASQMNFGTASVNPSGSPAVLTVEDLGPAS